MAMSLVFNGEKYDLAMDDLTMNEAVEIERVTGWTFGEYGDKRAAGSALAMKAGAYVVVKRQVPDLRFDSFDFTFESVQRDETDGGEVADPTLDGEPVPDPT